MYRILLFLITIFMALQFTSCKVENIPVSFPETSVSNQYIEPDITYMYELIPLRLPEDKYSTTPLSPYTSNIQDGSKTTHICTDNSSIQVYYYEENNADSHYLALFDWDGNHIQTIHLPRIPLPSKYNDGIRTIFQNYTISDNEFIGIDCRIQEKEFNLFKYTSDGHITHDLYVKFEEQNHSSILWAVADNKYAFHAYNHLYVIDFDFNLLHSCTPDRELKALFFRKDGSIYVQDWYGVLLNIDLDTGITTEITGSSENKTNPLEFYRSDDTYYSVEPNGIYYIPISNDHAEEKTLLMDWLTSGVVYKDTEVLAIHDDEHMLILSENNIDGATEYAILKKLPADTTIAKEKVLLRTYGIPLILERAVAEFNRTNRHYHIEVQDHYPHYTENRMKIYEDYEERITAHMFTTMAEGDIPDLFLPNSYTGMLLLNLEKQGYLADLSSLTDRLTGSARGAVTHSSSCVQIPYVINYNTITTNITDNTLTAEMLTEYAAELAEGEALFSEPLYLQRSLISAIQSTFVEKSTASCSFETPLFTDYLELLGSLENLTDVYLGGIDTITSELAMTLDILPDNLASGKLPFLFVPIRNLRFMHLLRIAYDNSPYTFCGFPDTMLVVQEMDSLAVLKDGKCTKGAMAFLEFLLSKEVQSSDIISSLGVPVTTEAVRTWLDNDWYFTYRLDYNYYYIQEDGIMLDMLMGSKLAYSHRQKEPACPDGEYYMEIQYTDTEKNAIMTLLETDSVSRHNDPTLTDIINEEVYTYLSGDRTAEDTAHILQSRVSTYLAE